MAVVTSKAATGSSSGFTLTHDTANGGYIVVGNSSVSNIASGTEYCVNAAIAQVSWGISNGGYIEVKRGANSTLVLTETGTLNFIDDHMPLTVYSTANVNFTFNSGIGFLVLELQKQSNNQSTY